MTNTAPTDGRTSRLLMYEFSLSTCIIGKGRSREIYMTSPYDNVQSQTNEFGQTSLLYIINGKIMKFVIKNLVSGQFSILIIGTDGIA